MEINIVGIVSLDFSFFDYLEILFVFKFDNKDFLRILLWSENVELKKKRLWICKKKFDLSLKFIIVYIVYFL